MKKAPKDGEFEVTRDSWLKKGQLSGAKLSKEMRIGENSSKIWSSFQNDLSQFDRESLLNENSNLRLYQDLINTLNSPVSNDQQDNLADLVKKQSKFIANQLQYDLALRQKFILSLRNCSHITATYKILLAQIAKTPVLAKDFETLLLALMNNQTCAPPFDKPELRGFLKHSIEFYPAVADTMLKYPTNFSVDLIALTVLSSKTLPLDFKDNLKSTLWNVVNTLKILVSTYVSSALVDFFASEPPISSNLIETLLTTDLEKLSPVKTPVKFNELRTISASEIKQQEGVFTKGQGVYLNEFHPEYGCPSPGTPIINGKVTHHHTLDDTLLPLVDGDYQDTALNGEPYVPTYFTLAR